MAHVRKDTLVRTVQWWKHYRPYWKRLVSKLERKASKKQIEEMIDESIEKNREVLKKLSNVDDEHSNEN